MFSRYEIDEHNRIEDAKRKDSNMTRHAHHATRPIRPKRPPQFRTKIIRGALERSTLQEHEIEAVMQAVNNYDAMREALEDGIKRGIFDKRWLDKAQAALALGKGDTQ